MTYHIGTETAGFSDDAQYRTMGARINTLLAAVGLVQTADTGQANWGTATRPAANTYGEYEIWRFNDSLQATAPIFFKLQYGTGPSAGRFFARVTVGVSSNGSGTITGLNTGTMEVARHYSTPWAPNNEAAVWAITHSEGVFAFSVGSSTENGVNSPPFSFVICRTDDGAGAPDGYGALFASRSSSLQSSTVYGNGYFLLFAADPAPSTHAISGNLYNITCFPGARGTYMYGSDYQTFLCWSAFPQVKPLHGIVAYSSADIAPLSSAVALTPIGSVTHNYMPMRAGFLGAMSPGTTTGSIMVKWE